MTRKTWGWHRSRNYAELIIADEAERLRPATLELLLTRYDRDDIALILIGVPGLQKQFGQYPSSTVGSGSPIDTVPGSGRTVLRPATSLAPPSARILAQRTSPTRKPSPRSRVTRGKSRLLERLIPWIQRMLKINELDTITNGVIEAAQNTLVIGVT